jgi:uncharacterized RDD family membrane protein YckC
MALTDYSVLTPERVRLQYDIAGIGSRGAAAFIDTMIQLVLGIIVMLGLAGLSLVASELVDVIDTTAVVIIVIVLTVFMLTIGYSMLFEIIWNGQTPGKRIVGVRVIRENGYPLRPLDAVIRNLVRIVDALPSGYAIGLLTMLFNKRAKRLGDFAAGTIVVREGVRSPNILLDLVAPPDARPGPSLSSADGTLVRDFLLRRADMHPTSRADLAQRLAASLAARYGVTVDESPERFLERLSG